jgi:hypothetical protein
MGIDVYQPGSAHLTADTKQTAKYNAAITSQDQRELTRLNAGRNSLRESLAILDHGCFVAGLARWASEVLIRRWQNVAKIVCAKPGNQAEFSQNLGRTGELTWLAIVIVGADTDAGWRANHAGHLAFLGNDKFSAHTISLSRLSMLSVALFITLLPMAQVGN